MELSPCVIVLVCIAAAQAADWGYTGSKGPKYWGKVAATCIGQKQSPVNIISAEVSEDPSLGSIKMTKAYDTNPSGQWKMNNNGHSVGIATVGDYEMSQGGLGAVYKLYGFHFHWGSANWQGSEHTVNGKMYPLEVHFVHYNSKYTNVGEALNKTDGLAVLGLFFEISDDDNEALAPVVDKLTSVVDAKDEVNIDAFNLLDLMGGDSDDLKDFYRYSGSLTTPGCFESVTWTVFHKILKVSQAQMTKFRSCKDAEGEAMVDNFRPVQPLFTRKVYTSKLGSSASSTPISSVVIFTSLTLALSKLFS